MSINVLPLALDELRERSRSDYYSMKVLERFEARTLDTTDLIALADVVAGLVRPVFGTDSLSWAYAELQVALTLAAPVGRPTPAASCPLTDL